MVQDLKHKPLWRISVGALVVVAVAAGGWGVYSWNHQRQIHDAVALCTASASGLKHNLDSQPSQQVVDARSVQADQVTDAKTVDAFKAADKKLKASVKPLSCDAAEGAGALREHAQTMDRLSHDRQSAVSKAESTASAVIASKSAKVLSDGKAALQAKSDEGSKLLDYSEGKVADNACRESLRQAVVDAGKASGSSVVADVDKARLNVQGAIDAVNANMQAKATADAQAATAAQAVQAAVPAPSWTQTQRPAPSYAKPQGQGHRNYQAPAAPAPVPAAPAQPAPQQGGSKPSWRERLDNAPQIGSACNAQGVCGIG